MYILVDIANGHMEQLLELSKYAKEKFGDNLVLMVGNIANAETYILYSMIGVDYVVLELHQCVQLQQIQEYIILWVVY